VIPVTQQPRKRSYWLCISLAAIVLEISVIALVLWWTSSPRWKAEWLKDPNPAVRVHALRNLPNNSSLQILIDATHDADSDVRLIAAGKLGGAARWRPDPAARAEALVPLLKDDHLGVRREAAWSLGTIGRDALPLLMTALQDENPYERAGAALALYFAYFHKEPSPWPSQDKDSLVPILTKLLDDESLEVRERAKEAIAEMRQ
jgi:HEAT repeat protein